MTCNADEQTRQVQAALKEKGFYYGEADGQPGPETMMAVRRYQIRNGLPVTGSIDESTLRALEGSDPAGGRPAVQSVPAKPKTATIVESDRQFLKKSAPPPPASPVPPPPPPQFTGRPSTPVPSPEPPPEPLSAPSSRDFVAGTPLEGAESRAQAAIIRRAQSMLNRQGYDAGPEDGIPGPATGDALAGFQEDEGLRVTGRLDAPTMDALGVLAGPSRETAPRRANGFEIQIERGGQVLRGVWVR